MSATKTNEPESGPSPTADSMADDLRDAAGEVSPERAQRFYDRLRERVHRYAEAKGKMAEKSTEFLLLVPDIFILLWRLANDARVNSKNKLLLGGGIAYYFFPLDIIPELFMGPVGFFDDLVFGAFILNRMLSDTDPEVIRKHWSGSGDVLDAIQKVLKHADTLVSGDLLTRLKRMMK